MPSSSLIFVLVVAIWAAYLLQHWIRRRDHLSTARSVDRFSEAMRVLERRKPLPESPLAAPEPRSYAVSPARPHRAEVTVKRAATSPVTGRSEAARVRTTSAAPTVRVTGRLAKLLSGMTRRRLRGASLMVCAVLVIASTVLVALGRLAWWSVPAAAGVLVLDLLWLRHAAAARGRRGRQQHAARTAQRVRDRRIARATGRVVTACPTQHVDTVYDPEAAVAMDAAEASGADEPEPDVAHNVEGSVDSGGWQPVPVPPPTYTLKAKAERPVVPQAAVTPSPEPFDRTAAPAGDARTDADTSATGDGRDGARVGGEAPYGQGLPFDGLALDEELEELPAVYAAG